LALKGNQGTPDEDVRLFLETEVSRSASEALSDTHVDVDAGHGRIETRKCVVSDRIDWLKQRPEWIGLKTIAMIEETRRQKNAPALNGASSSAVCLPMPGELPVPYGLTGRLKIRSTGHWT
jgi:hypothetical protein